MTTTSETKRTRKDERELVNKLFNRYRLSAKEIAPFQRLWATMDMLDRGEQWKGANIPEWVPKPQHNMMRFVRILKRSNLASNIPSAHFSPINQDHAEIIDKLDKAYRFVWQSEKVDRTIRKSIDRMLAKGTSVAFVYTDDTFIDGVYYGSGDKRNRMFQGRIMVKSFPITNFYPDPDAYSLDECKFVETTQTMSLKAVKANKTFRKHAGKLLDKLVPADRAIDDQESGEVLHRDIQPSTIDPVEGDEKVTVHTHWEREYDPDKKRYVLNMYMYCSGADFTLYEALDLKPNKFPCALLLDEEEDNQLMGSSISKDIMEDQKIINKVNQTASTIGALHQNPQKVVSAESNIDVKEMARKGNMPGVVWKANGDPSRAVAPLRPDDIPKGLFELKDRMVQDIKDYVGVNEAYTGQSIGSLTTSSGVNSLIDRATIRDKDKMVQIDEFVERISELIVLNIIYKWKHERPITVIDSAGKPDYDVFTPIKDADAENLRWLVKSDVYASSPVTQSKKREEAKELLQMQGQFKYDPPLITVEEYIRESDYAMKDVILDRMKVDRERKQALEAEDWGKMIAELATQVANLVGQGTAQEKINQTIQQMAQQLVQQREQAELMKRPRDAEKPSGRPEGEQLSPQAENNMMKG